MTLKFFNDFPPLVKKFLFRFFFLFSVFEFSIYLSQENFDRLNRPITEFVANGSVKILNEIHEEKIFLSHPKLRYQIVEGEKEMYISQVIFSNNQPVLLIADSCNGFELYALFVGFLLAIPFGTKKLKTLFIFIGVPILILINIIRCIGLIELQLALNSFFDFYHHFLFKIIMYSFIFLSWVLFMNLTKITK